MAGMDTVTFSAHSARDASTSKDSNMGVTTVDTPKAADWSSESVFQKFYYKPDHHVGYGQACAPLIWLQHSKKYTLRLSTSNRIATLQ